MSNKEKIPKQFLGAFKAGHRLPSREFIDEELSYILLRKVIESNYEDLESIRALAFITKFNNEYYKNVIKKGDEQALHSKEPLRKDCYARENARNADVLSKFKFSVTYIDCDLKFKMETLKAEHNDMVKEVTELRRQQAIPCLKPPEEYEDILNDLLDLA